MSVLRDALRACKRAWNNDDDRPFTTSVRVRWYASGALELTATDGRRLHRAIIGGPAGGRCTDRVLSEAAVLEMLRHLSKGKTAILAPAEFVGCVLTVDEGECVGYPSDDFAFPDVDKLVTTEIRRLEKTHPSTDVASADLIKLCKNLSFGNRARRDVVRLRHCHTGLEVKRGDAKASLIHATWHTLETVAGDTFDIYNDKATPEASFQPEFIAGAAAACGNKATIAITGKLTAAAFSSDSRGFQFLAIVMPLNVT